MVRLFLTAVVLAASVLSSGAQSLRVDTLARAPYAQYPVALAFAPDGSGKFFFTEKNSGRIRVFDGRLLAEPFATVLVENNGEQGLSGIAFHPSYPDSPFVYVYYTRFIDRANVVERFRDSSGVGVDPRLLLIIPRLEDTDQNNGGALRFGPDGKLYLSVGDFGDPSNAQDITSRRNYRGKILRLNPDGSIPDDNPLPARPFWAVGARNVQGITFDRKTGLMYCTDGSRDGDNVVFAVTGGGDLGWPFRLNKPVLLNRFALPLHLFRGIDPPALTGIALYEGTAFPRLNGHLLVAGNAVPALWALPADPSLDSLTVERIFSLNTGFADVQVGPDECLYLTNGPLLSSRILRLAPVSPSFTSEPPTDATQGLEYTYTPSFAGTPPSFEIIRGPENMRVNAKTWSISWTPDNEQAVLGVQMVTLRARNGAGTQDQIYSIRVRNTNDPPLPFALGMAGGAGLTFLGDDPVVTFRWARSVDPDNDPLRYALEIDTVSTFSSRALRRISAGDQDSLRVSLPRVSNNYFWRVTVTDGAFLRTATPSYGTISVVFTTPEVAPPLAAREEEDQPEPGRVYTSTEAIQYSLPRSGHVRLSVYNLLGQEVALVQNGFQEEGSYTIPPEEIDLPNGIYFYRVRAPGYYDTKKLVVAK